MTAHELLDRLRDGDWDDALERPTVDQAARMFHQGLLKREPVKGSGGAGRPHQRYKIVEPYGRNRLAYYEEHGCTQDACGLCGGKRSKRRKQ